MPDVEAEGRDVTLSVPAENWLQELAGRREEAIKVALRNFLVSRQFTTDGSLAEPERVVRFYEGVVMSLEPSPGIEAFGAATRAFKDVLRYEGVPKEETRPMPNQNGLWGKRALRTQAAYNLAVLFHRRAVQLREDKDAATACGAAQAQQSAAAKQIDAVLAANPSQPGTTVLPFPDTWKVTAKVADLTSSLTEAQRNVAPDSELLRQEALREATARYKDTLDAIRMWGLEYRDWDNYKELTAENIWKKIILETGVAAIVGSLLLEVEQLNGKAGETAALPEARRTELIGRLEDARLILGKSPENLRGSMPPQEVKANVPPAEEGSVSSGGVFKVITGWLRTAKSKLDEGMRVYMPKYNKPLGVGKLQEEMLQQLVRVQLRLRLIPGQDKGQQSTLPAP